MIICSNLIPSPEVISPAQFSQPINIHWCHHIDASTLSSPRIWKSSFYMEKWTWFIWLNILVSS